MAAQPVSDPVTAVCALYLQPSSRPSANLLARFADYHSRFITWQSALSRLCIPIQSNPIQYVCPGRRAATKQQANIKPSRSVGSHGMEWNGMEWNGISSHVPALISRAFWRADRPTRVCSQGVTSLHHACVPPLRVESAAWRESGNEVSTLPRMRATGPT